MPEHDPPARRFPALIGWRLLALLYDFFPMLALWMLLSTAFTLGYTYLGDHPAQQNIAPFSALQWLLWLCCWLATGVYATNSWRRGGQTLGMRPWRLEVVAPPRGPPTNPRRVAPNPVQKIQEAVAAANGGEPTTRVLWQRYAMATLSLLAAGLGLWWAWVDREGLTWHDRASGTRLQRRPKSP